MNKLVKGSVAAAAGIALLMGGAGSLALWNDSVAVNAGTVSSGSLDLAPVTGGGWDQTIAKIVPGDTLTYTKDFTVTAVGDNLDAELTSNIGALTSGISGATVTSTFVVKEGATTLTPTAGTTYAFDGGNYTVKVTITVAFASSTSGQVGQNQSTDLSAVAITLSQV